MGSRGGKVSVLRGVLTAVAPSGRRFARMLTYVAAALLGTYALAAMAGHLSYRAFLYPAPTRDETPAAPGARIVELVASDGARVHAMEFPNPAAARTVVYFHGNGEVMSDEVWIAQRLVASGFASLSVSYVE